MKIIITFPSFPFVSNPNNSINWAYVNVAWKVNLNIFYILIVVSRWLIKDRNWMPNSMETTFWLKILLQLCMFLREMISEEYFAISPVSVPVFTVILILKWISTVQRWFFENMCAFHINKDEIIFQFLSSYFIGVFDVVLE